MAHRRIDPGLAQFLDAKMQDLTPFLSGDAIKDYPNLAAHPTGVWRTTVYSNKIYGVGDPLAPFFWAFCRAHPSRISIT